MTSLLLTLLTSDDPSSMVTLHGMKLAGNIFFSCWSFQLDTAGCCCIGRHIIDSHRDLRRLQILSFKPIISLAPYCCWSCWLIHWFKIEVELLLKCSSCCLFDVELFTQKTYQLTGINLEIDWLTNVDLELLPNILLTTRWSFKLW